MPVWPADLPQSPTYGLEGAPQDNVLAFRPEIGGPKTRRRSTASGEIVSATFEMSTAQRDSFRAFYTIDCAEGAVPFEWVDPLTGQLQYWAFEAAPRFTATQFDFNSISLSLRRLP